MLPQFLGTLKEIAQEIKDNDGQLKGAVEIRLNKEKPQGTMLKEHAEKLKSMRDSGKKPVVN